MCERKSWTLRERGRSGVFEIVRVHLSCFVLFRFVLSSFSPSRRARFAHPVISLALTVSTPAVATWGYFAEIAAMSASERPSDFKKAAASPAGAEAAATLPRALGFLLFAFALALALVERRDLPIDDAKEGPWL